MSWHDLLRPASFRGAPFRVDTASKAGGRRGQTYEFPKSDRVSDEDLGRRAGRWALTGWVIGEDYTYQADLLEAALTAEGPGLLVHPLMGEMQVRCETYTRSERRVEGGMATFDLVFVEAGQPMRSFYREATDAKVEEKVDAARAETAAALDNAPVSV